MDLEVLLAVEEHGRVELQSRDCAKAADRAERRDDAEAGQHLEVAFVAVGELVRVGRGTPAPMPRW